MLAVDDLKQVHRSTWAAGDYSAVAERIADAPPRDVLSRLRVAAGQDVLDVATGTGNAALRAAARGARVVGVDLTPELLDIARRRALTHGLDVSWKVGDAEELPADDAAFDRVISVVGIQFAPRHEVVARELARVTRPGGRIGLVNWTPDGHIGELLRTVGSYMPPPPAYASPPPLWGREDHVRELFDGTGVEFEFAYGTNPFRFASAEDYVAFMETHYGPVLKARERLSAVGTWGECRAEIVAVAERHNDAYDGSLLMNAEYLVAIGTKTR
jgi:SAM-dependent methyltransferase